MPVLLGIYLGSLALGGILIAASVILGGHGSDSDHDSDHDADADHDADSALDHDADHDADSGLDHGADAGTALAHTGSHDLTAAAAHPILGGWLPVLSLRFWTFGLASFGATGALLAATVLPGLASLAVAVPTGLVIGTGVSALFRHLKGTAVGHISGTASLAGREATVLLPIRPGGLGKIRIPVDGPDVDMPARTREPDPIPIRTKVLVITVEGGVAEVIPLPGAGPEPG